MKKYLSLFVTVVMLLSSFIFGSLTLLAEPEEGAETNKIDASNAGFEDVTDIKQTNWYKLVDSKGNSAENAENYTGISIKTDGGHTGKNYLSISADKSWYSPAINIYPYIKEAGAGTYVVSFWYRLDVNHALKNYFLVRGLESDAYEESDGYYPNITSKDQGNFYSQMTGSVTDTGEEWKCFISDPFEVVEEQFDADHNWWFCLDNLPNSAFVLDIDDFSIVSEDDFEDPTEEDMPETDLTYLTSEVESNIFPAVTPNGSNNSNSAQSSDTNNNAAQQSNMPENELTSNNKTVPVIIIAIVTFVVVGIAAAVVVTIIQKKKSAK